MATVIANIHLMSNKLIYVQQKQMQHAARQLFFLQNYQFTLYLNTSHLSLMCGVSV